ncbi:MAG: hypothetical protein AMXMBFR13_21150 [Phycisphaerae bacterium]
MRGTTWPEEHARFSVAWILVAACLSSALDAQPVKQLTAENERFTISATAKTDASKSPQEQVLDREISIKIKDKEDEQPEEFVFHQSLLELKEILFGVADKIILVAELPFGGDTITVLDAKAGKVHDVIRAYGYSLSPSKQFLVYKSWYPRLGDLCCRKSILIFYDLARSASSNRPSCTSEYSYENAGIPIFPEKNAHAVDLNCSDNAASTRPYDVNLDDEYYVMSPFLWSDDDKKLVFFAYNVKEQKNYLVQVDLTEGPGKATVGRRSVNVADYTKWDVITDFTKQDLAKRPYKFGVKDLQWGDENEIMVETHYQYWLERKIEMSLP